MKQLKYFKLGDKIPNKAKYIKSETLITKTWEEYHPMGSDTCKEYEEFHLYEIPA